MNEIRPGTYLLGDRQQFALGAIPADGIALVVAATVVSDRRRRAGRPRRRREDADQGSGAVPRRDSGHARPTRTPSSSGSSTTTRRSSIPAGTPAPKLGEVVAVVPNHVCPVVDLFDAFVVARAGGSSKVAGRSTPGDGAAEWAPRPRSAARSGSSLMRADGAEPSSRSTSRASRPAIATLETNVPDWARLARGPPARLPVRRPDRRSGRRLDRARAATPTREVYAGVAWESVYVDEAARGRGVGRGAPRGARAGLGGGRHLDAPCRGPGREPRQPRPPRACRLSPDRRPGADRAR